MCGEIGGQHLVACSPNVAIGAIIGKEPYLGGQGRPIELHRVRILNIAIRTYSVMGMIYRTVPEEVINEAWVIVVGH